MVLLRVVCINICGMTLPSRGSRGSRGCFYDIWNTEEGCTANTFKIQKYTYISCMKGKTLTKIGK